ncbi:DUF7673 family protein [Alteromonas antoniana]|uniref:DUF7673 family protein n=1 Tax=Alteromonas antoniana TaxID=2803813 RepID=UPI001C45058B|nr:hypothetical protein [Alteromonas antoniana]
MANERILARMQETEFLRQKLIVTERDYSDAVSSLLNVAQGDTSGSRAAAQVLLSTYNGSNFHMDLTDLCVLDLKYVEQALIVLRGRVILCIEPHQMIDNGKTKFSRLEKQWEHLYVKNRHKN